MRRWPLVFLLVLIFFAAGCNQARNKFEQVHLGMNKAEVIRILGQP